MRIYRVPLSITEEPKHIGGKISLRQFFYLVAGFATSYAWIKLSLLLNLGLWVWMPALLPMIAAIMLAFVRIDRIGGGLDRYLFFWFMYRTQPQKYVYHRFL
jgi:hypothetical protein